MAPTFLWQKPTFPFGFPNVTEPDVNGDIVMTYPPSLTKLLKTPMSQKQCETEGILYIPESKKMRHERRAACAKIQNHS